MRLVVVLLLVLAAVFGTGARVFAEPGEDGGEVMHRLVEAMAEPKIGEMPSGIFEFTAAVMLAEMPERDQPGNHLR